MSSHLVSIASSANKFMSRVAFSQNLHLCDFSQAFCSSSYCIKCRSELIVKSCTWLRSEVTLPVLSSHSRTTLSKTKPYCLATPPKNCIQTPSRRRTPSSPTHLKELTPSKVCPSLRAHERTTVSFLFEILSCECMGLLLACVCIMCVQCS